MINELYPYYISQNVNEVAFDFQALKHIGYSEKNLLIFLRQVARHFENINSFRKFCMETNKESRSDFLLAVQLFLKAFLCFIRAKICFCHNPHFSWELSVSAEYYMDDFFCVSSDLSYLIPSVEWLCREIQIIQTSFPKQSFISPGIVADRILCTICNIDAEDCFLHRENNAYNGNICRYRSSKEWVGNHIAYVKNPNDKRSRVVAIKCPRTKKWLDWMTLNEGGKMYWKKFDETSLGKTNIIIKLCLEKMQITPSLLEDAYEDLYDRMVLYTVCLESDLHENIFALRTGSQQEFDLLDSPLKTSLLENNLAVASIKLF